MKKLGAVLLITALVLQLFSVNIFADQSGATYYVAPNGSDIETAGSIDTPFKTISYASKFLKPGDTCYIKAGVYRETVTPMNNGTSDMPITYKAYGDGEVVISGCDVVTDWEKHEGNVYKASMDWDMGSGEGNIVFINDELGYEGRWPNNIGYDDSWPTAKGYEGEVNRLLLCGEYPVISSASFSQIDTSYGKVVISGTNIPIVPAGTKLWCSANPSYNSIAGVLTEPSTKTSITAKVNRSSNPISGDIYALIGALELVDVQGEWYKDRNAQLLYVYSETDPNLLGDAIEAKKREYGIDLSDRKNIIFDGIGLRATAIKTNDNTSYCTYKNATVQTVAREMVEIGYPSADGIILNGTHNTIAGCTIKDCFGMAVRINGSYNRVINNLIENTNLEGSNTRTVWIYGSNQLVSHNTIRYTGRFATGGTFTDSVISYNDMYGTEGLTEDGGVLYLNDHDYGMSEIHHNYLHDNLDITNYGQMGLYFDTATCSLLVYNNIIWNIDHEENYDHTPICAATYSDYCIYFNNTIINHQSGMGHYPPSTAICNGGTYINNLFARQAHDPSNTHLMDQFTYINNIEDGRAAGDIVDGDWLDDEKFGLQPGSAAIDAGTVIPGVNEDYIGEAPDIGAREYGDPNPWTAGHDFDNEEYSNEPFALNLELPFKNMLKNREFEDGLEGWTTESGNPSVLNQSAWGYSFATRACVKNGYYSLMLKDGDVVSQRIEGLKPNTKYLMRCYSRTAGEYFTYSKYDKSVTPVNISTNTGSLECQDGNSGYAMFTVDFDEGQFDTFRLTIADISTDAAYCKLLLDSTSGTELGRAYFVKQNNGWNDINFYDITFDQVITGEHKVYFVFDSGNTGKLKNTKFRGFEILDIDSADEAQIDVKSDTGETVLWTNTKTEFERLPEELFFTTGQAGYADVTIRHNGGNNVIYFDALGVQEVYNEETNVIPAQPVLLKSVNMVDLEGNAVTLVKDNTLGIVGLTFENHTNEDMEVTGSVTSYTATGRKGETVTIDSPVSANKTETLGLGITIADSKGYLVLEFTLGEEQVFEYHIPVWQLSNGMNADVLLKGLVINGGAATGLVKGQTNNLAVSVQNSSASSIGCTGYLAIYEYEDGVPRLKNIVSVEDTIETGADTINISIDVPSTRNDVSATLLLWKNDGSLQPITEVYKFK